MIRLELKYCERCGGLLLRRAGEAVVYCGSCAKSLNELPVIKKVEKVGERKKGSTLASETWGNVKKVEACEKQVPRLRREDAAALGMTGVGVGGENCDGTSEEQVPRLRREDAAALGMTAGEGANKKEPQSVGVSQEERRLG